LAENMNKPITKNPRLRMPSVAVVCLLALLAACSSSGSGGDATTTTTTVAAEILPPTIPPPASTEPLIATTAAPTTVPAPQPLTLRGNGLGEFDFGRPALDVVRGVLLPVVLDRSPVFALDPGSGLYISADGLEYFSVQFAREVCWDDGALATLCAIFGGVDPAGLLFLGWNYSAPPGSVGALFSASGVTINVLASAVPAIPVPPGACYSFTTVTVDDISINLQTSGEEFGTYAADGTYTPLVPIPASARVTYMNAGEQIFGEGVDC